MPNPNCFLHTDLTQDAQNRDSNSYYYYHCHAGRPADAKGPRPGPQAGHDQAQLCPRLRQ